MSLKPKIILPLLSFIFIWTSVLIAQEAPFLKEKFDEARKKLHFALDMHAEQKDPLVQKLLDEATVKMRQAQRQLLARRPFLTNRLINESNQLINQALKISLKEPAKKRKAKLDELAGQAEELISKSENAQAAQALQNGLSNRDLAYQAYLEDNFEKSVQLYNLAYQQLTNAINLADSVNHDDVRELENEAYRFNQFFEMNKEILTSSNNNAVRRFRQSALNQVRKAEQAGQSGDVGVALDFYRKATRLLNRALDVALGKAEMSVFRVYDKLAQLDELVDNIDRQFEQSPPEQQLFDLLSRVKLLQSEAHQAVDDKNFGIALNKAQEAMELVNRIHRLTKRAQ